MTDRFAYCEIDYDHGVNSPQFVVGLVIMQRGSSGLTVLDTISRSYETAEPAIREVVNSVYWWDCKELVLDADYRTVEFVKRYLPAGVKLLKLVRA